MKNISEWILAIKSIENRNYFFQKENLLTLKETEKKLAFEFPIDISEFYSVFNGGFYANNLISEKRINDGRFFDELEWESNSFLTLDDIIYYYNLEDDLNINFKREENITLKKLIPFFKTKEQELLVFDKDSTILRSKEMENHKIEWIEVEKDFKNFVKTYIKKEGVINL